MAVERLLSPQEATDRLAERGVNVTARTVRRWIATGQLASVELPSGRRVVPESVIDAMLTTEAAS